MILAFREVASFSEHFSFIDKAFEGLAVHGLVAIIANTWLFVNKLNFCSFSKYEVVKRYV